jgi:hypothetical protein
MHYFLQKQEKTDSREEPQRDAFGTRRSAKNNYKSVHELTRILSNFLNSLDFKRILTIQRSNPLTLSACNTFVAAGERFLHADRRFFGADERFHSGPERFMQGSEGFPHAPKGFPRAPERLFHGPEGFLCGPL